jgi:multidrug efflux pump subunit AcrA (membrane-fusion protein)
MNFNRPFDAEPTPETDRRTDNAPPTHRVDRRRWEGRLLGPGLGVILIAALVSGAWSHYAQHRQVIATAEQSRDFVPQVRVAAVQPSESIQVVNLPATTSAFSAANVFARASGYIAKREVDIGDRVKAGQLLAEIVAPELDHQIVGTVMTI